MARKCKAAASGSCKMSASLAVLVLSRQSVAALGVSRLMSPRTTAPPTAPDYHVLVRCTDPATTSIGNIPLARGIGLIRTAVVPAASLAAFAADDNIERVSAPRQLHPLMDIASPLVGAPQYSAKHTVSGKGVLVGIVDTGIDAGHPAFAGRILKLWDQDIVGPGPGAGFSKLGTVLAGAAMAASSDMHGHGTHVAVRHHSGSATAVDAWLLLDQDRPGSARFAAPVFDTLIGSPGSGHAVITVASYTCRNQWTDISGAAQSVGLAAATASELSSPGPLRGGALKPDVTAPGAMIASCLSSASSVDKGEVIAQGYRMMAGTSMASPVVAGLLALYQETHPKATPAQAKAWLKSHSAVP